MASLKLPKNERAKIRNRRILIFSNLTDSQVESFSSFILYHSVFMLSDVSLLKVPLFLHYTCIVPESFQMFQKASKKNPTLIVNINLTEMLMHEQIDFLFASLTLSLGA